MSAFGDNNDFDVRKQQNLVAIQSSDPDKSPKGFLDAPIVELVSLLNQNVNYCTTSSCSGRTSVFFTPGKFEPNGKRPSAGKGSGRWLFITHDKAERAEVWDSLNTLRLTKGDMVWLYFEPFILSVECRSLNHAQVLTGLGQASGFRETGITTTRKRFMVSIRSSLRMEVPLVMHGKLLVDRDYVCTLVDIANEKFTKNVERIDRFTNSIITSLAREAEADTTPRTQSITAAADVAPGLDTSLAHKCRLLEVRQRRILHRITQAENDDVVDKDGDEPPVTCKVEAEDEVFDCLTVLPGDWMLTVPKTEAKPVKDALKDLKLLDRKRAPRVVGSNVSFPIHEFTARILRYISRQLENEDVSKRFGDLFGSPNENGSGLSSAQEDDDHSLPSASENSHSERERERESSKSAFDENGGDVQKEKGKEIGARKKGKARKQRSRAQLELDMKEGKVEEMLDVFPPCLLRAGSKADSLIRDETRMLTPAPVKSSPPEELMRIATQILDQIFSPTTNRVRDEVEIENLLKQVPRKWEKLGDTVLLPSGSFTSDLWTTHVGDGSGTSLWSRVAQALGAKQVARQKEIAPTGTRDSQVEMLFGTNTWVEHKEGGLVYGLDVTLCMFSSGNVTEKARMAARPCLGETIVDLFCGIGYYTIPLLAKAKAAHVYACDWNPNAIRALKFNLQANGVQERCTVLEGDCRVSAQNLQGVAHRVLLGLLPSSEVGWEPAVRALCAEGGVLHVHENVAVRNIGVWSKGLAVHIQELLCAQRGTPWLVTVEHVEEVKSYAPHVKHIVVDLLCRRAPPHSLLTPPVPTITTTTTTDTNTTTSNITTNNTTTNTTTNNTTTNTTNNTTNNNTTNNTTSTTTTTTTTTNHTNNDNNSKNHDDKESSPTSTSSLSHLSNNLSGGPSATKCTTGQDSKSRLGSKVFKTLSASLEKVALLKSVARRMSSPCPGTPELQHPPLDLPWPIKTHSALSAWPRSSGSTPTAASPEDSCNDSPMVLTRLKMPSKEKDSPHINRGGLTRNISTPIKSSDVEDSDLKGSPVVSPHHHHQGRLSFPGAFPLSSRMRRMSFPMTSKMAQGLLNREWALESWLPGFRCQSIDNLSPLLSLSPSHSIDHKLPFARPFYASSSASLQSHFSGVSKNGGGGGGGSSGRTTMNTNTTAGGSGLWFCSSSGAKSRSVSFSESRSQSMRLSYNLRFSVDDSTHFFSTSDEGNWSRHSSREYEQQNFGDSILSNHSDSALSSAGAMHAFLLQCNAEYEHHQHQQQRSTGHNAHMNSGNNAAFRRVNNRDTLSRISSEKSRDTSGEEFLEDTPKVSVAAAAVPSHNLDPKSPLGSPQLAARARTLPVPSPASHLPPHPPPHPHPHPPTTTHKSASESTTPAVKSYRYLLLSASSAVLAPALVMSSRRRTSTSLSTIPSGPRSYASSVSDLGSQDSPPSSAFGVITSMATTAAVAGAVSLIGGMIAISSTWLSNSQSSGSLLPSVGSYSIPSVVGSKSSSQQEGSTRHRSSGYQFGDATSQQGGTGEGSGMATSATSSLPYESVANSSSSKSHSRCGNSEESNLGARGPWKVSKDVPPHDRRVFQQGSYRSNKTEESIKEEDEEELEDWEAPGAGGTHSRPMQQQEGSPAPAKKRGTLGNWKSVKRMSACSGRAPSGEQDGMLRKLMCEDEFLARVVSTREPVVLTGPQGWLGSAAQPGVWTSQYLTETVGQRIVGVHVCPDSRMNWVEKNFKFQSMTVEELIEHATQESTSTDENDRDQCQNEDENPSPPSKLYYYLRSIGKNIRKTPAVFEENFPEIASDVYIPKFFRPEAFFSSVLRVSSPGVHLWCHFDVMDNILLQLVGYKRVLLFPPEEDKNLYVKGSSSQVMDFDNPNFAKFPRLAKVRHAREVILAPGEVLYIPPLWFHAVQSTSYLPPDNPLPSPSDPTSGHGCSDPSPPPGSSTMTSRPEISLPSSSFTASVNVFWKRLPVDQYSKKDLYGNVDPLPVEKAAKVAVEVANHLSVLPMPYSEFYTRRVCRAIFEQASKHKSKLLNEF